MFTGVVWKLCLFLKPKKERSLQSTFSLHENSFCCFGQWHFRTQPVSLITDLIIICIYSYFFIFMSTCAACHLFMHYGVVVFYLWSVVFYVAHACTLTYVHCFRHFEGFFFFYPPPPPHMPLNWLYCSKVRCILTAATVFYVPRFSTADWRHCVWHWVPPDDEGPDEHAWNHRSCLQQPRPECPGKYASWLQLCTGSCFCNAVHHRQPHSGHPSKNGVGWFCSLWRRSQHGCLVDLWRVDTGTCSTYYQGVGVVVAGMVWSVCFLFFCWPTC